MIRLAAMVLVGIPVASLVVDATAPAEETEIVTVLVARKALPRRAGLRHPEKLFKPVRYFKGEEPRDAVTSFEQLKGKILGRPLAEDQPLKTIDLLNLVEANKLPPGTRAVAIKIQRLETNDLLIPGSRVDVLIARPGSRGRTEVSTFLRDLLLLAMDSVRADQEPQEPTTAAIAVPLSDVNRLAEVAGSGSLLLVVRPVEDK
jgi:Flp pilus assembly protein CpaB